MSNRAKNLVIALLAWFVVFAAVEYLKGSTPDIGRFYYSSLVLLGVSIIVAYCEEDYGNEQGCLLEAPQLLATTTASGWFFYELWHYVTEVVAMLTAK